METIEKIKKVIWEDKIYQIEKSIKKAIENREKYIIVDLELAIEEEARNSGYDTSHVTYDVNENLFELVDDDGGYTPPVFLKISWK